MTTAPRIIFAGGGTAGHLFPGLAVAQRLRDIWPAARITFVGSGKALEARHVTAAGYDYLALPCRPWPRRLRDCAAALVDNLAGYLAARRLLVGSPCAAVIGLGGYASVPAARAALARGVPLLLLEQNVVPGRATRWLAPRARLVCAAFAQTRHLLPPRARVIVTGTPLRAGFDRFLGAGSPGGCDDDVTERRQVLVLGGSNGARSLNENVPRALYKLRHELAGWRIVHQSGPSEAAATADLYDMLDLPARVEPFLGDMPAALAASGLVVGRAGGTTLAELSTAGVPAVLIPYPHATDDHQLRNAQHVARAGACLVFDERGVADRPSHTLAGMISVLVRDPLRRQRMGRAMRLLMSQPDAAAHVAALVRELALDLEHSAAA